MMDHHQLKVWNLTDQVNIQLKGGGAENITLWKMEEKNFNSSHVTPNKYAEVYGKMGTAIMYHSTVLMLCQIHRL